MRPVLRHQVNSKAPSTAAQLPHRHIKEYRPCEYHYSCRERDRVYRYGGHKDADQGREYQESNSDGREDTTVMDKQQLEAVVEKVGEITSNEVEANKSILDLRGKAKT